MICSLKRRVFECQGLLKWLNDSTQTRLVQLNTFIFDRTVERVTDVLVPQTQQPTVGVRESSDARTDGSSDGTNV